MADAISQKLYARACELIPGGVNSPVRAFKSVGGEPIYIRWAKGPWIEGADSARYVDYVGSWGPMILGHAHPEVIAAIQDAAELGTSYGAPHEGEIILAQAICEAVPSIEKVRMVSSGTEAVMGALRVARGFTGRDLVVKLEGCYHGGADYLLVKAGSGLATFGTPDSAGVPAAIAGTTLVLPFNDTAALRELFAARGREIAALIVEPVVGNMGCVPPEPGYLEALREVTAAHGALLVFDEVMTGFRLAYGGAQQVFRIKPDLTCLGKIVGGGMPLAAYGGRAEVMDRIAPVGPVYQGGTLSGNPVAVAAGVATLRLLRAPGTYERLEQTSAKLERIFEDAADEAAVAVTVQRSGSMLTPFFHPHAVKSWDDAAKCDKAAFGRWHAAMIAAGVYWPPSQFEAGFVSLAHDDEVLDLTRTAAQKAFQVVAGRH
jgi:glutamate-1-semialdehyde 2,1-aminomutase